MELNYYFPHAKSSADFDIGYIPLDYCPRLQEVEGLKKFPITMGGGRCQIFPIMRRQGAVRGLYKWYEEEDGLVDGMIEKEKLYYLMF